VHVLCCVVDLGSLSVEACRPGLGWGSLTIAPHFTFTVYPLPAVLLLRVILLPLLLLILLLPIVALLLLCRLRWTLSGCRRGTWRATTVSSAHTVVRSEGW
jgi:hypothetical protein